MKFGDVQWNEEARQKILQDADQALQSAVREAAQSCGHADREKVYEFLFEKLKGQFVDFQPGPDLSKYADAVFTGEFNSDD